MEWIKDTLVHLSHEWSCSALHPVYIRLMKTSSLQSKRRGHYYDSIRETNGQVYPLYISACACVRARMNVFVCVCFESTVPSRYASFDIVLSGNGGEHQSWRGLHVPGSRDRRAGRHALHGQGFRSRRRAGDSTVSQLTRTFWCMHFLVCVPPHFVITSRFVITLVALCNTCRTL